MDEKPMKVFYDPKADLLEVLLVPEVGGVTYDTEDDRVEVTVDESGRVLSFHIMGLQSSEEDEPIKVILRPKVKTHQ